MRKLVKQRVLPAGRHMRRLRAGIGRGISMPIDFEERTRLYLGLYEVELNRHLRRMLTPGIASFDVGGQLGYDALVIAKLTGGRVTTFEPDAWALEQMALSLAANPRLAARISVERAAAGTGNGAIGLDEVAFRDHEPPAFVKVDVDGGEHDVLLSAPRLLSERRPHVIIETHTPALEQACGSLLVEHGYRPVIVHQRRVLPDHRPAEHNRWLVAYGA